MPSTDAAIVSEARSLVHAALRCAPLPDGRRKRYYIACAKPAALLPCTHSLCTMPLYRWALWKMAMFLLICFLFLVLVSWELCLRSRSKWACMDRRRRGVAAALRRRRQWWWQEKVFALVVFGEKNAAFVLVPARLHTYVVLFWVGEEAARHHLHEQACFLHSTPKPACSNPSGTASLPPPPLGSRTSLGGGGGWGWDSLREIDWFINWMSTATLRKHHPCSKTFIIGHGKARWWRRTK